MHFKNVLLASEHRYISIVQHHVLFTKHFVSQGFIKVTYK